MAAFLWFYLVSQDEFSYNYVISNYTMVTFFHTSILPLIQSYSLKIPALYAMPLQSKLVITPYQPTPWPNLLCGTQAHK